MAQGLSLRDRVTTLSKAQLFYQSKVNSAREEISSLEAELQEMSETYQAAAPWVTKENIEGIEGAYQTYNDAVRDRKRLEELRGDQSLSCEKTARIALLEQKALALYSSVLDKITKDHVEGMSSTLNDVFAYVFQNPAKRATLQMVDRYNKKVLVPTLITTDENGVENAEGLDDSGFSVSVVLGTVLLLHYIIHNNLTRVVFFDESFGGLSDETAARFFTLLRVFIDNFGFSFMLVSHESRFVEYVDRSYFARHGRFVLEGSAISSYEEDLTLSHNSTILPAGEPT